MIDMEEALSPRLRFEGRPDLDAFFRQPPVLGVDVVDDEDDEEPIRAAAVQAGTFERRETRPRQRQRFSRSLLLLQSLWRGSGTRRALQPGPPAGRRRDPEPP